jgi:hypothetical protein
MRLCEEGLGLVRPSADGARDLLSAISTSSPDNQSKVWPTILVQINGVCGVPKRDAIAPKGIGAAAVVVRTSDFLAMEHRRTIGKAKTKEKGKNGEDVSHGSASG